MMVVCVMAFLHRAPHPIPAFHRINHTIRNESRNFANYAILHCAKKA